MKHKIKFKVHNRFEDNINFTLFDGVSGGESVDTLGNCGDLFVTPHTFKLLCNLLGEREINDLNFTFEVEG